MVTREENLAQLERIDPALADVLRQRRAGAGVYSPAVVEFERAADLLETLATQCDENGMRDWSPQLEESTRKEARALSERLRHRAKVRRQIEDSFRKINSLRGSTGIIPK